MCTNVSNVGIFFDHLSRQVGYHYAFLASPHHFIIDVAISRPHANISTLTVQHTPYHPIHLAMDSLIDFVFTGHQAKAQDTSCSFRHLWLFMLSVVVTISERSILEKTCLSVDCNKFGPTATGFQEQAVQAREQQAGGDIMFCIK